MKQCLAFAVEKLDEVRFLKEGLEKGERAIVEALNDSRQTVVLRQSEWAHNKQVADGIWAALEEGMDRRRSAFPLRQALQRKRFKLPAFPTTTIGSFPQTQQIGLHERLSNAVTWMGRLKKR